MKKIYILAALTGVLFSACKKSFIELSPESEVSAATFYQTEDQFKLAVTAIYDPLRDLMTNDFYLAEMRSDNTHYEYAPSNRGTANVYRENIADFVDPTNDSYTNAVYFHCYSGISKANIVIERLPAADFDDALKKPLEGQAKFLRALNYFKLLRYFGGVPLFLKEVKKAEDAFLLRSTSTEVYDQIIADAKDAITNLDAPAFPQTGVATKGSATMLLAEVYMTQKKFAEAELLLISLQSMGYTLLPNYADVFDPAKKNSKESIFEVQYLEGTQAGAQPNTLPYIFLPRSTNTSLITGVVTNSSSSGGWNIPTKDLINAYEPNDKRLDASIGIAEGTYNASNFLSISASKSVVNYSPAAGKVGVPYIKKMLHPPYATPNNTNENFIIYRYADALLMLAEAQNEQGKSVQALQHLNLVRDRAFGAGVSPITETNQSLLRDLILHERRVELAFENHRWHDLVRSGKAIAVMNAYGNALKQQYDYLGPETYQVDQDKLLFPIPQSERELNPGLTQNEGYLGSY